jgi:branched-chain amino acid transport system permease protein
MLERLLSMLSTGILLGGIYSLLAMGLTIILGVVRIMTLAHGAVLMLAMYLSYWAFQSFGIHPYISAPLVIVITFFLGVAIQRIVIQPIPGMPMDLVMLVTLALALVLENVALILWGADYKSVHTPLSKMVLRMGPLNVGYPRLIAFVASIFAAVAFYFFLKKTLIGKALRAVAQNRESAELMGIPVHRIYMLALGLGSALAGLAGVVLMPIYYVFPTVGSLFMLVAIVAIFLGGLGNMMGCLVGGIIIGIVEVFSGYFFTTALKETFYFSIFILVLLFRPTGLLGLGKGSERIGI